MLEPLICSGEKKNLIFPNTYWKLVEKRSEIEMIDPFSLLTYLFCLCAVKIKVEAAEANTGEKIQNKQTARPVQSTF